MMDSKLKGQNNFPPFLLYSYFLFLNLRNHHLTANVSTDLLNVSTFHWVCGNTGP